MSPNLTPRKRALAVAATLSLAAAGMALTPMAANAAVATTSTLTPSQSSGPQVGGNSITLTASAAVFNTTIASNALQWQFASGTKPACATHFTTATATSATAGIVTQPNSTKVNLNVLTTKKAVIKVPAATVVASTSVSGTGLIPNNSTGAVPTTSQAWLLCLYSSTDTGTSTVLASGTYTIAPAPTFAVSNAVTPAGGPALGGGTVTVTGTNLTGASLKIGSVPVTPVTVATGGASLTFTAPAMTAGVYDITITTVGGTITKVGGYTYSNGIVVSPNTTPTAVAATDLDISGVGFSKLDFTTTTGATPDDAHSHVYVVQGTYNATANTGLKTLGEAGECVNVTVVSDSELICTVNTLKSYDNHNSDGALANGTYTVTVASDGSVDAQAGGTYTQSVVSSGSTFTVADY